MWSGQPSNFQNCSRSIFLPEQTIEFGHAFEVISIRIFCAKAAKELGLFNQRKCGRIKLKPFIDPRRRSHKNAAHEALSPREVISLNLKVLLNITVECAACAC